MQGMKYAVLRLCAFSVRKICVYNQVTPNPPFCPLFLPLSDFLPTAGNLGKAAWEKWLFWGEYSIVLYGNLYHYRTVIIIPPKRNFVNTFWEYFFKNTTIRCFFVV